jgi:uncharacterized protein with NAD-binding domain and iron-sulfur cluster
VGIPSVPLADLYEGCRAAIANRGGEVRLRSGVREIRLRDGAFASAALEDHSEISADACIAAVPHTALPGLLPAAMAEPGGTLAGLSHIRSSPITGVHLWFDRIVMKEPFLALLDHTTQWVFNKSQLYGERKTDSSNGQYLQLVISASYDLVQCSRQEIIELCRRELEDVLPAVRDAEIKKATVIKEISATFSPDPGVDRFRLGQQTDVKNLFFAGDWTRTGWPSTMEGAVRSGYLAAEAAMAQFGQSQKFLQPDLPLEGLSRYWARRNQASKPRAQ